LTWPTLPLLGVVASVFAALPAVLSPALPLEVVDEAGEHQHDREPELEGAS
jgi:hypothetical protein